MGLSAKARAVGSSTRPRATSAIRNILNLNGFFGALASDSGRHAVLISSTCPCAAVCAEKSSRCRQEWAPHGTIGVERQAALDDAVSQANDSPGGLAPPAAAGNRGRGRRLHPDLRRRAQRAERD